MSDGASKPGTSPNSSISSAENALQIEAILASHPELRAGGGSRAYPHIDATDGAFAARLEIL